MNTPDFYEQYSPENNNIKEFYYQAIEGRSLEKIETMRFGDLTVLVAILEKHIISEFPVKDSSVTLAQIQRAVDIMEMVNDQLYSVVPLEDLLHTVQNKVDAFVSVEKIIQSGAQEFEQEPVSLDGTSSLESSLEIALEKNEFEHLDFFTTDELRKLGKLIREKSKHKIEASQEITLWFLQEQVNSEIEKRLDPFTQQKVVLARQLKYFKNFLSK